MERAGRGGGALAVTSGVDATARGSSLRKARSSSLSSVMAGRACGREAISSNAASRSFMAASENVSLMEACARGGAAACARGVGPETGRSAGRGGDVIAALRLGGAGMLKSPRSSASTATSPVVGLAMLGCFGADNPPSSCNKPANIPGLFKRCIDIDVSAMGAPSSERLRLCTPDKLRDSASALASCADTAKAPQAGHSTNADSSSPTKEFWHRGHSKRADTQATYQDPLVEPKRHQHRLSSSHRRASKMQSLGQ
jgi:hypothetical protein